MDKITSVCHPEVQSVLFDNSLFTQNQAENWLRLNSYRTDLGPDEKGNFYRYRQLQPSSKYIYRTISSRDKGGLYFVMMIPKKC